jgi:hypothetical protein
MCATQRPNYTVSLLSISVDRACGAELDCAPQIIDENVAGAFGDHTMTYSSPFHGTVDATIVLSRAATGGEMVVIYAVY